MYQVGNAIVDIIQTGDRFPPVSHIRSIASGYREFKTAEVPQDLIQIEQFTGEETERYKGMSGDDFFKEVMGSFGDLPYKHKSRPGPRGLV